MPSKEDRMTDREKLKGEEYWDWEDCLKFWGFPWIVILIIGIIVLIILRLM